MKVKFKLPPSVKYYENDSEDENGLGVEEDIDPLCDLKKLLNENLKQYCNDDESQPVQADIMDEEGKDGCDNGKEQREDRDDVDMAKNARPLRKPPEGEMNEIKKLETLDEETPQSFWPKINLKYSQGITLKDHVSPKEIKAQAKLLIQDLNRDVELTQIRLEQDRDPFCQQIVSYITEGILPDDRQVAKRLTISGFDYLILEGVLYHILTGRNPQQTISSMRIVLPQCLRLSVLNQVHIQYSHVGVCRMISILKNHWMFPNMAVEVAKFVASCPICALNKKSQHVERPPYSLTDRCVAPGDVYQIDLIGPLNKSQMYVYICVVIDSFSKFCTAFPLRNKTAKAVAKGFYKHVICVHGPCKTLRSDGGGEFAASFEDMAKMSNIDFIKSAGYTPFAQHSVERMNQTLINSLRSMVYTRQSKWADFLPAVVFGYNSCPIEGDTFLSPYLLQFGRTARMPPLNVSDDDGAVTMSQRLFFQHELLKQSHETMSKIIKARQQYAYENTLPRKKISKVIPGKLVFMKSVPRKTGNDLERRLKFEPAFKGPYLVVSVHDNNTVGLCDLKNGKYLEKPIHLSRLKFLQKLDPSLYFAQLHNGLKNTPTLLQPVI